MIKSLKIKNIQSHKNSELEFSPGINTIIGSSNNGKSAILRALFWTKYNRPLGIDTLASHWAVNDKGELKDEMSVTVENEFGTITRKRTKDENQYIVNGKVLNVVKTDVPDEVEKTFCLSDTNIQRQLDEPFLLSKSSGEVAKYFNKVVRLDVIDRVLTNAETSRRKTQSDIKNTESQIENCKQKLENFDWLDSTERLIEKYESVSSSKEELENSVNKLNESLAQFESLNEKIIDLSKQKKIVDEIYELSGKNVLLSEKIHNFSNDLNYVQNLKIIDFSEQKKLISKIENWDNSELENKLNTLSNSIHTYTTQQTIIENCEKEIESLKKQLPDICPYCGRPMDLCKGGKS